MNRVRYILRTGLRKRVRDIVLASGRGDMHTAREDLARRYLRGDGIEIGALTWPMRLPPGARVRYVDHAAKPELVAAYGDTFPIEGTHPSAIPETDVIDDGATLATVADASVDFVIANHVLEHIEDPVGTLETWVRVLRPGGILFITLPDARHTFDAPRERTTVEHVLRDHAEGPEVSRRAHHEEWARIDCVADDEVEAAVAGYAAEGARHHFHVWELETFLELLHALELPWRLEAAQFTHQEFVVVLRRV